MDGKVQVSCEIRCAGGCGTVTSICCVGVSVSQLGGVSGWMADVISSASDGSRSTSMDGLSVGIVRARSSIGDESDGVPGFAVMSEFGVMSLSVVV